MLLFDSFSRTAMLNSIISRLKTKHRFNKNNYNLKVNDTVEDIIFLAAHTSNIVFV